jgi:tetratricopeptide (TPR) repeat protein
MGRAFALRDRGELEESLAICKEAIGLADPVNPDDADLGTIVVGARTIDEIATRLGQRHLAREHLARALLLLQRFNRDNASRANDLLARYERQIRERLDQLRSAG